MSARPVPAPSNPGVPGKSPAEPLPPLPAGPRAGRYRHFKGHEYEVLGCARHSETLEPLVIYRSTGGGNTLWARPLAMFMDTVALPNGEQVPRFARAGGSGPA
ncbi:MAG: DUF1653 domain-containing protein [Opitutaceae bacterium]|jgi:hypothetical protein|nr:DUF1653 domain-containing protein [Opitutaceae bacterium]